ncbi:MAG TPA: PD-(D/E)XK nuclease family protein [Rhabdochlamydiaceae bacterium]
MEIRESDFIWHEGRRYARATATIKDYASFGGASEARIAAKGAIGTLVHNEIDGDLRKEMRLCLPPEHVGYFHSYRTWRDAVRLSVIKTEERYFDDELMFSGQIDLLATFPYDDTPVLIDWKTSSSESKTWVLQAHLYAYLIRRSGMKIADRYLFIKLHPFGGKAQVFEYIYSDNNERVAINCVKKFWSCVEKDCQILPKSAIIEAT